MQTFSVRACVPCARVRVRQFLCKWLQIKFQKCACGCVHATLLGAGVCCTSAQSFFVKKSPKNLIFSNISFLKISLKKCVGVSAGIKKMCAGACAANYHFCAMCVQVPAKKSAH